MPEPVVPETPVTDAPPTPEAPTPDTSTLEERIDAHLGITTPEAPAPEPPEPVEEPAKTEVAGDTPPAKPAEPQVVKDTPPKVAETPPTPPELTLTVTDAEGKEHVITSVDDLPEDFTPKNNQQIFKIITDLAKLDQKRAAYEQEQATAAKTAEEQAQNNAIMQSWDTEITALRQSERLPVPKVDATDPNYLKDPAMVRLDEVFKYMSTENQARVARGVQPIRSVEDALDKLELAEIHKTKTNQTNADTAAAKAKSGVIARGRQVPNSDQSVYRAGSATSIFDL